MRRKIRIVVAICSAAVAIGLSTGTALAADGTGDRELNDPATREQDNPANKEY